MNNSKVVIVNRLHPKYFAQIMKQIKKEVTREQVEGTKRSSFYSLWHVAKDKEYDKCAQATAFGRGASRHGPGLNSLTQWAITVAVLGAIAVLVCYVIQH